jgi:hypothetical protein
MPPLPAGHTGIPLHVPPAPSFSILFVSCPGVMGCAANRGLPMQAVHDSRLQQISQTVCQKEPRMFAKLFASRRNRPAQTTSSRCTRRLAVETMEPRAMMAAGGMTATLQNHVLWIQGTEGADTILVAQTSNQQIGIVDVPIQAGGRFRNSVPASQVSQIRVAARGGDDFILRVAGNETFPPRGRFGRIRR